MSKTRITFAYAGYIWITNREGGNLRRLTSEGHERHPIFSPDGSLIAFTGDQGGSPGLYVVSSAGGQARQLTYHPADIEVACWTPDGKSILFSSRRAAAHSTEVQLFIIPATGGAVTPLALPAAAEGGLSPDAKQVAYVPNIRVQPEWKHYRGGQTTPILIANLGDSNVQAAIPRDNSNDFEPMWVGDTIYFLSDRNGPVTLFSYSLKSRQVTQVIKNDGLDIKSASASSDAIVYEQFGSLHLLDLKSRNEHVLNIKPVTDTAETRPHFRKIEPDEIQFASLSPTGADALVGVHGEILVAPTELGTIRDLTNTTDVVERDPAWSPDGKSIAYLSDASGEYALHIRVPSGHGTVRTFSLGDPPSFFYSPAWSPDSKKIAYTDKRLNYWYVDLDKQIPVRIDSDLFVEGYGPTPGQKLAWSPDSRWIAYTKNLPNHLHAVFVYSIEQAREFQLTDGMSDTVYVAFDREGKYLYFTASTDVALRMDHMTGAQRPVTRSVYIILLRKDLASPVFAESAKESAEELNKPAPHKAAVDTTAPAVEIDLDDIGRRIVALPIPPGNYRGLLAGKPGEFYLLKGPQISLIYGHSTDEVYCFGLRDRRIVKILDDASTFALSFGGSRMLYRKYGQWFTAPTQGCLDTAEQSKKLNLESMQLYVDPRVEWKHMFEQVWRNERDFFYDPELHGLNLETIKKKYQPYLVNVSTRDDLNYLFSEMLGNMVVSHMRAAGGDVRRRTESEAVGLLGADYVAENGRYRIVRIYRGDTWNPDRNAPLAQPGINVQAGEYLLAVNGQDVRPAADIFRFFKGTAGHHVTLKVGPNPGGAGARTVTVIPIENEAPLRQFAWSEDNRRKVEELSGGRVGYVYLPDTLAGGYTNFNRYYFAQVGKDAIIIDVRYNMGGDYPDYIIDHLRRPLLNFWNAREGRDTATPTEAIFGPKVMIINEMSMSGGELLPWMFRKVRLGPLIGMRTWGGEVGDYTQANDLLDGGYVATPNLAFYGTDGTWDIENRGVAPDVEVSQDPKAVRAGHDPQLEKAVEIAMDLLKKNPAVSVPRHPPYPNYGTGLH